ncbi:MAG: hypothetical protein ACXW19_00435 [Thermoanaerobaculia bacterium]
MSNASLDRGFAACRRFAIGRTSSGFCFEMSAIASAWSMCS